MTGEFPRLNTDHEDGNRVNNRWSNLRDVSSRVNARNKALNKTSTTGVSGVQWNKNLQKYQACICTDDSKIKHIGLFNTIDEAKVARDREAVKLGYHPAHGMTPQQRVQFFKDTNHDHQT